MGNLLEVMPEISPGKLHLPNFKLLLPDNLIFKTTKKETGNYFPEGLVVAFGGPRGAAKSLLMNACVKTGLFRKRFRAPPSQLVLANFKTMEGWGQPFSLMEMMSYPDWLLNADVMWDEIDRDMGRTNTLVAEFIDKGLRQIRKRFVYFYWCAQYPEDDVCHSLLRQTNILITSRFNCPSPDLCISSRNAGGPPHIPTGHHSVTYTALALQDMGDTPRGYTWPPTLFPNIDRFFNLYNTNEMFDIFSRMRVKVQRPKAEILRTEREEMEYDGR
jgi:hypothetical protein